MGNCMETCRVEQVEGEKVENRVEQSKVNFDEDVVIQKDDDSKKKNSLRVKVVVTKEELQWLMMQLSNREGGGNNKRIEDVLGELQKGRKRFSPGWKPCLDSISEIPEVLEMHR